MQELGVHSEVGKLRTVMVCRPGLAHQRLTPGNAADLQIAEQTVKQHRGRVMEKMDVRSVAELVRSWETIGAMADIGELQHSAP